MTKSALKAYLEAGKRETRLIGAVEKFLLTEPPDESRRTDVFHPSEMVREDWCLRASYFAVVEGWRPTPERHNLRTSNIFDEGHAIHDKWQQRIWRMGNLYSKFACLVCNHSWWDLSPQTCPSCEADLKVLRYNEVPMVSEYYEIAGHSDGWVVGLGDDYLIEIKSVGTGTLRHEAPHLLNKYDNNADKAWEAIRNPFRTHHLQGQMYLHLVKMMEEEGLLLRPAPSEIVFIYEWKANQDFREFTVRYSPDYIQNIMEKIDQVLDADEAPPCTIDAVKGCKKCRAFDDEDAL